MVCLRADIAQWIKTIRYSIPQPGTFWTKRCSLPPFDEKLNCVFDRKFFMQIIARDSSVVIEHWTVAAFRLHGESKTAQLESQFYRENMTVNYELLDVLPAPSKFLLKKYLQREEVYLQLFEVNQLSWVNIAWNG